MEDVQLERVLSIIKSSDDSDQTDLPLDFEDRLLEVDQMESGKTRVHIESKNLSLKNKIDIERYIETILPNSQVNFRKAGATRYKSPQGFKVPGKLKRSIPGVKRILAVASGKGGVGKSTVSVNIAVGLQQLGWKVGLLDADLYGPSLPTMMGMHQTPTVQDNKLQPVEVYGVSCISSGFLADEHSPVIWRGPMISKAFEQFLFDVNWPELDVLVLDLPPGTGDIQMTMLESLQDVQAVVVTTPQEVALQDAHRALAMFEKSKTPVLGVIENMAYYECSSCGHKDPIFGSGGGQTLALEQMTDCLGRIPLDITVRKCGDYGQPIVLETDMNIANIFKEACRGIQQRLESVSKGA